MIKLVPLVDDYRTAPLVSLRELMPLPGNEDKAETKLIRRIVIGEAVRK